MRHFAVLLVGFAGLAALAASAAHAQPRQAMNAVRTGSLAQGSDARFRVTAAAGDLLEVHVQATFDPTVEVLSPGGDRMTYDDDGGEGVSSYVARLPVERSGDHTIVVGSFLNNGSGRYEALVRRLGVRAYQACDGTTDAEQLPHAGDRVVLGRHREVGGDENWASDMSPYVGRETTVRTVPAPDDAGCPVVSVTIDDGDFFWRVRDLTVIERGPLPIQACGLEIPVDFESVAVGSQVILGRHRAVDGDENWASGMDAYVGRTATVTRLYGTDNAGCGILSVGIDGGDFTWRVRDVDPLASPYTIPQVCDQPSPFDHGPVQVGTEVVLGRHRAVGGDENWNDDMDRSVGRTTTVTEASGADPAGCPTVKVSADGGDYFWRIRDMQVRAPGAGLPQACESGDTVFGPVEVGTRVVLGRHRAVDGDANWTSGMDTYVGRAGRVTALQDTDNANCAVVQVDTDNGDFYWRVRDMTLAD